MYAAAVVHPALPTTVSRRVLLAMGAAGGTVAVAVSAALGAMSAGESPAAAALVRALVTGAPIGVGLWAVSRGAHARFGVLLAGSGALWCATTLAESSDAVVYSVGRVAGWSAWVALLYLALAFPAGRLVARADRVFVRGAGLGALALFGPQLLLADAFTVPSPFASCTTGCPANAFSVLGGEPAFVAGVLQPLSVLFAFAVTAALALRLLGRRAEAAARARQVLTPVAGVAAAFASLVGLSTVVRAAPDAEVVRALALAQAICLPAISVAFLVGIVRSQLVAGRALEQLARRFGDDLDGPSLRRALAEAFDDPSIRIVAPAAEDGRRRTDVAGDAVGLDGERSTEVRHDGRTVATLVHGPAPLADPKLVAAGCAMAGVVLENHRLTAETLAAMHDVRRSRARIAASALQERRRIERDLHDGAQQRLVALRIELGLAEELVLRDPDAAVARLRELESEVDDALEEMRSLAHGVYPATLADRGVEAALRAAVRRSPLPVAIEAHAVGRYPAATESAVYFCAQEAVQNVLKHAPDARRIVVELDGDERGLRFSVRDDGSGPPDGVLRAGRGITNMHDRLAAIGGEVEIVTTPHAGTIVRGRAPARVSPVD